MSYFKNFPRLEKLSSNLLKNKYFIPTIKRIFAYSFLALLLFLANKEANTRVDSYTKHTLEAPTGGILFVNQANKSDFENGSIKHPFRKIGSALDFTKKNNSFKIIHLSAGTYEEKVTLPENITLVGEVDLDSQLLSSIQSPKEGGGNTVTANINTRLFRLLIENGRYNVYIPKDKDNVLISNCIITKASRWGIFNEKGSLGYPKLRIIKTSVIENKKQGAYLEKSSIEIRDSFFNRNGEEGIDLHTGVKAVINNVEVMGNKEGGLETEVGDVDLIIENSKFIKNEASGINLQTLKENSSIEIKNNIFTDNLHFGIRCALHAPIKSPYFIKMVKISSDNFFDKNGKAEIDPICKTR